MTKVSRGYLAQRRRTKIRSFASNFQRAHSRLNRAMVQQKIRSLSSAHRDRNRQKRDFRRLWIIRLSLIIRGYWVYYNYSKYINKLYKQRLILNRKTLAQINILNRNCFSMISNEIIKT